MSNFKRHKIRYVLGIDPSGNFYEGKGITGWCLLDRDHNKLTKCGSIKASQSNSQEAYWQTHLEMLTSLINKYREAGIVVSIEDYVLYSKQAKAQINSALETSQLIGVIKMHCFHAGTPLYIRTATRVKSRWTDTILCNKGYIHKTGGSFFTDCKSGIVCEHERDSIRHAVHCATFELEEEQL